MNGEFTADGTGFDKVLDTVDMSSDEGSVAMTDKATGTTLYEINVATGTVTTNLLPDEIDNIVTDGMDLADLMAAMVETIEPLYATSIPSLADLQEIIRPIMADDFLDDGYGPDDCLIAWADPTQDEGPPVGLTIDGIVIYRPMGVLTFGDVNPWTIDELGDSYTVGVWCVMTVSFGGKTDESFITSFVQTTSGDWKWYGNRLPFRHGGDIEARANRRIMPDSSTDIYTGLNLYLRDEGNLALSNFGIDLVLVFNDVLPELIDSGNTYNTLVLSKRSSVETEYKIVNVDTSFWDHLYLERDGLDISSMDDPEYICVGFTDGTDGSPPTAQHVWIDLLEAKPIKGSELSADDFPVITAPSTHDVSNLNIPGQITVSWNNPAGKHGDWVSIWWGDSSGDWTHMDVDNPAWNDSTLQFEDWTSCTFDTSSTTVYPPNYAGIQVYTYGELDRIFGTIWEMEQTDN